MFAVKASRNFGHILKLDMHNDNFYREDEVTGLSKTLPVGVVKGASALLWTTSVESIRTFSLPVSQYKHMLGVALWIWPSNPTHCSPSPLVYVVQYL